MDSPDESRVLIIYTGGTIGMLLGHQGYVPEPHFLTETLRSQSRFHDPLQDSLFSNAGTVQGFRQWSSASGRSSPLSLAATSPIEMNTHRTLPVRSTRSSAHTESLDPKQHAACVKHPEWVQISDNVFEAQLPSLVTPRSPISGGGRNKSIRYAILEWDPLLDSSNFGINDWIRIATEIELNYQNFDAFVVLHGTDTMSYTSSALSFLLEDLGKSVILTGAQIPMSQLRNDAVDNLLGALTIAGHFIIPECCLYFNHTLYRGNRVSKLSSYDLSAFSSPNFPPLVNGKPITYRRVYNVDHIATNKLVLISSSTGTMFYARPVCAASGLTKCNQWPEMSPHVATLRLFPGITAATFSAFFMPPIRGVILETFGAGNAPQRPDLIKVIKEACDRGIVVVAITQCIKGSVSDAYETGRSLLRVGVVPGNDMTPECALAKLTYLLSKPELSIQKVRDLMGVPLRGELSKPSSAAPSHITIDSNLDKIQNVLSHFLRLSHPQPHIPNILITSDTPDQATQEAAASWTWTVSEAATTEAVLLPFLVHLAVARDDVEGLNFCLSSTLDPDPSASPALGQYGSVAGGLVNSLDPGSGRSPLHVAALNGNLKCINVLLRSGALVHLRDALGHTALYYAARQGYEEVVDMLVQTGATLGGVDNPYVDHAIQTALRMGDEHSLRIWAKTGVTFPNDLKAALHRTE